MLREPPHVRCTAMKAPRRWVVPVLVVLAIGGGVLYLERHAIEEAIAGPLGREYCREMDRCGLTSSYEYCVHYIAVDTLDGRPVRDGCGECLRSVGCEHAITCSECGFDGR